MTRRMARDFSGLLALYTVGQIVAMLLFKSVTLRPILGGDSRAYLDAASHLFSPSELPTWTPWYLGYVVVLRVGSVFGSAIWFAAIIQTAAVIAAAGALLSLGRRFGRDLAGWIAAAFFLMHPPIAQVWRYVITEPLFYSGIILTAWLCVQKLSGRTIPWWTIAVASIFTASLRPNGLVVPAAVVTIFLVTRPVRRRWVLVALTWTAVLALGTAAAREPGTGSTGIAESVWSGRTIYAYRSIRMPGHAGLEDDAPGALDYVARHPLAVARLGATRIGWELIQVRPWYSRLLNLYIGVSMAALYILAAVGAYSSRRTALSRVIVTFSLPFMLVIAATWAVFEGRFGWWFLCLWTVWAGIGADRVAGRPAMLSRVLRRGGRAGGPLPAR